MKTVEYKTAWRFRFEDIFFKGKVQHWQIPVYKYRIITQKLNRSKVCKGINHPKQVLCLSFKKTKHDELMHLDKKLLDRILLPKM